MKLLPVVFVVVWFLLARAALKSRQGDRNARGRAVAPVPATGAEGQRVVREQAAERRAVGERVAAERASVRREELKGRPVSWKLPESVTPHGQGAPEVAARTTPGWAAMSGGSRPPMAMTAPASSAPPRSVAMMAPGSDLASPFGSAAPGPPAQPWAGLSPISLLAEPVSERRDWAAFLRQPGSLRQAMVASEILRRPAC